jgi:hypothetical protein
MTCCVEFSLPIQIQDDADRITENLRQFMAEDAPDATWRVVWFDPMETAAGITTYWNGVPNDDPDDTWNADMALTLQAAVEA